MFLLQLFLISPIPHYTGPREGVRSGGSRRRKKRGEETGVTPPRFRISVMRPKFSNEELRLIEKHILELLMSWNRLL